jgi:hypothetical protein
MFVFQGSSCSHEATGAECGQVPRRGDGPIPRQKKVDGPYLIKTNK